MDAKSNKLSEKLLDTKLFIECKVVPNLMADCITEFLKEQGFSDEEVPPTNVLVGLYCTFAAAIAIREKIGPSTPMRKVVERWDQIMLSYAAVRTMKDMTAAQNKSRIIH